MFSKLGDITECNAECVVHWKETMNTVKDYLENIDYVFCRERRYPECSVDR